MRILIADFDPSRAKAHAEATAARGFVVDRVATGAAALELALELVPDIIVCPIDLPLIDGERLAEILRSNPRTRHACFVFLVKDELDAPMSLDPRDGTVVAPWHDEDVLDHIDAAQERSARFGGDRSDTEIEGRLTQISLVDLLQIFQMNKRSGTLRIWRRDGTGSGSIAISEGQILDAGVPLSDGGSIVGEKALYRLFSWRDGRFEFVPGPVTDVDRIGKPSRALVLEGTRQLDEWDKLRRELPSRDLRLTLRVPRSQIPENVHPLTAEVLDCVEAYRRVGEVVDHCSFPDYQVLRVLQDLIQRGALARETKAEAPGRGAGVSGGVFNPSQVRRIRDWSASQRPRPGSVLKLLAVGATSSQIGEFHQALRECPDFMSDARAMRDPARVGGLGTIGYFALDDRLSLRVVGVPAADHYAPLWDVAAHGMLGAILLPQGASAQALAETEAAFHCIEERRPEAVVQLILCGNPEGTLSPEARSQLERFRDGSVFVLPSPGGPQRPAVLRSLFARLVP